MTRHIWSVLCRKSVIDQDTNSLSMYDVFEELKVDAKMDPKATDKNKKVKIINVPIEFELISYWIKDKKSEEFNGKCVINIKSPDGKVEKSFEQPLIISKEYERMRSRLKVQGFSVSQSGTYVFEVFIKNNEDEDEKKVASLPVKVDLNIS